MSKFVIFCRGDEEGGGECWVKNGWGNVDLVNRFEDVGMEMNGILWFWVLFCCDFWICVCFEDCEWLIVGIVFLGGYL